MSSPSPFPTLPKSKITFPSSPITTAAFTYTKHHTSEAVYNHCARSAYFALLLARKLPTLAAAKPDLEAVVLACVLHDMGWSHNKALLSEFKRFEVDGADIARGFIREYDGAGKEDWGEGRVQRVWDAIALHATSSIAPFASAEVAAAHLGVTADFTGPRFPSDPFGDPATAQDITLTLGAVITVEEFREILAAFPYAGFDEDAAKEIFCGLCRDKPASTFDNFVSGFGREYGFDGNGTGREEYRKMLEEATGPQRFLVNLGYLRDLLDGDD